MMSIYGNTVGIPLAQQSGGGGDLQEAVRTDGEKTKEILKTFSALQWD